jgi:hypothetical protein
MADTVAQRALTSRPLRDRVWPQAYGRHDGKGTGLKTILVAEDGIRRAISHPLSRGRPEAARAAPHHRLEGAADDARAAPVARLRRVLLRLRDSESLTWDEFADLAGISPPAPVEALGRPDRHRTTMYIRCSQGLSEADLLLARQYLLVRGRHDVRAILMGE